MFLPLAVILFDKGLIKLDMEVEIDYDVSTLGGLSTIKTTGNFMICSIQKNDEGEILIEGASVNDGKKRSISIEQIEKIDGMEPSRFAAVYGVAVDGSKLRQAKRRGRKPKDRSCASITIG